MTTYVTVFLVQQQFMATVTLLDDIQKPVLVRVRNLFSGVVECAVAKASPRTI